MRLDRLQAQAGSSMVTTNTLASMDEDDNDSALKRFNIILKVCPVPKMPDQQLLQALRMLLLPWVCGYRQEPQVGRVSLLLVCAVQPQS